MLQGSAVLIEAHSQYRGPLLGVAKLLHTELGAEIHLYVATDQEAAYYRSWDTAGIFASITRSSVVYEACRKPVADPEGAETKARELETLFGVTFNEIALTDRHLGRGFALGGFNHPRSSMSENTSYPQMLVGLATGFEFWRGEIEKRRPALIISGGKIVNVVARQMGVPVRVLTGSRYKNFHYWGHNEYMENPAVSAAYAKAKPDESLGLDAPYDAHLRFRAIFRKEGSRVAALKRMGYLVVQRIYWRVRRYQKAKGYKLREMLAMTWRRQQGTRAMTRADLPRLDDLSGRSFVYYPLHTEPETALQMLSPECFAQLAVIAATARDLPAGCQLAVKETFAAVGRRPRDFYGQIQEFKNVIFLNMEELGLMAARAAGATVTITGTGGFEAAVSGRPVITWGRRNLYNILPHVSVVTDDDQLKGYLADALSDGFDAERARHDGKRFLSAVVATSFDLDDFTPTAPDQISDRAVRSAYDGLLASLGETPQDTVPAATLEGAPLS